MRDLLAGALATPGLGWLALIIGVAGVVRGFAGFGTALIFMPLAAIYLPPVWVIIALSAADLVGPVPLVPRALREGALPEVAVMLAACALLLPVGTLVLQQVSPEIFRWLVALLSLFMVLVLASGWRHDVTLRRPALMGIGGVSGFLGGVTGLPGPPVILAYMSGRYEPARIRANTILYLLGFEILLVATLAVRGLLVPEAIAVGVLLILPYAAGNLVGAWVFDPVRARLYRWIAYTIIAASAVTALPVFG